MAFGERGALGSAGTPPAVSGTSPETWDAHESTLGVAQGWYQSGLSALKCGVRG